MMSPMKQPAHVVFAEERALAATPPHGRSPSGGTPSPDRNKRQQKATKRTSCPGIVAEADGISPLYKNIAAANRPAVATITTEPNKGDLNATDMVEPAKPQDTTMNNSAIQHFKKWASNDFRKSGSLLYLAMTEGQAEATDALIEQGYSLDKRHSNFETPLHLAIRTGKVEMVAHLLTAKAKTNISGPSSYCALHYAAHYNQPEIASLLLKQAEVDVDLTLTSVQQTPLYIASRDGHETVVTLLTEANANVNHFEKNLSYTPLHVAARFNRPAVIEALLATGKVTTGSRDNEGLTALMLAAKHGMSAAALVLAKSPRVDHDARCGVWSTIGFGWNAADIATYYGHVDLSIALSSPVKNIEHRPHHHYFVEVQNTADNDEEEGREEGKEEGKEEEEV